MFIACWCGGTLSGRQKHIRKGEKPCKQSKRAHADAQRQRRAMKRRT